MHRRLAGGLGVLAFLAASIAGAGAAHASGAVVELGGSDGGPDLGVSPLYSVDNAEHTTVGQTYKARLGVVNRGSDVQGILLEMDVTTGVDFATKYSNCEYAAVPKRTTSDADTWAQPVTEAVCRIDRPFAKGTYGFLDEQVPLTINEHALVDAIHYQVFEDTDAARASLRGSADFTKGTGPELTVPSVDTIYDDQGGNAVDTWEGDTGGMLFETHNQADFEADGGAVSGRVGGTVKATVGFTNRGPAWFGANFNTETATTFTVPEGAHVVQAPAGCVGSTPAGGAADSVYTCDSKTSVAVGQSVSYAFTLKIDKAVTKASGSVKVTEARVFEDAEWSADTNPANDTAAFVLTGKPGSASGGSASGGSGSTGSGSTGGGNSPGAQGDQGALADTGANGLGVVGGLALVVLAAGGGLWAVGQRRRVQA